VLYSFTEWLAAEMANRKSAARIVTEREKAGRRIPTELAIIVDRDRSNDKDMFSRAIAAGEKPRAPTRGKLVYKRGIYCVAGFQAVSTRRGATGEDHLTLLDELVDAFLCSADQAMREHHGNFEPLNGGYPIPDGVESTGIFDGLQEIGARYIMSFRIYRGVIDQPVQLGTVGSVVSVIHTTPTASDETVTATA
jgi:hypothetical protein